VTRFIYPQRLGKDGPIPSDVRAETILLKAFIMGVGQSQSMILIDGLGTVDIDNDDLRKAADIYTLDLYDVEQGQHINPSDVVAYIDSLSHPTFPEDVNKFATAALRLIANGGGLNDFRNLGYGHFAEWLENHRGGDHQPMSLKDDPAFRAGRQLLIEGGEKAIDMIESGHFYEDHDASTEALGDLRSLLDVVKDTLK
jgi:hypothetical protein